MKIRFLIIGLLLSVLGYGQVAMMSGGEAGSTLISPPSVLSNTDSCALWVEADVDNFTTVGDTVISQWDDLSGNDNHLAQATSASQPHYYTDYVSFDGVDDNLQVVISGLEQPTFVYIVLKQTTWTNNDIFYDGDNANSGKLFQSGSTPGIRAYGGGWGITASSDLVLNTWGIVRVLFDGANSKMIINEETAVTGDAGSSDMAGFTLGASGSPAAYANCDVKSVIVMKTAGAVNEDSIYNYFVDKYNL